MTTSTSPPAGFPSAAIAVDVPPEASAARVLRVVSSSVASGIALGYDRIEDLALAIGEVFSFLLSTEPLALRCTLDPMLGEVHIVMEAVKPSRDLPEPWDTSLNRVVLESIADDVVEAPGQISFTVGAGEPAG